MGETNTCRLVNNGIMLLAFIFMLNKNGHVCGEKVYENLYFDLQKKKVSVMTHAHNLYTFNYYCKFICSSPRSFYEACSLCLGTFLPLRTFSCLCCCSATFSAVGGVVRDITFLHFRLKSLKHLNVLHSLTSAAAALPVWS